MEKSREPGSWAPSGHTQNSGLWPGYILQFVTKIMQGPRYSEQGSQGPQACLLRGAYILQSRSLLLS